MKKRTLCLLLAGVMALSLLSGCGGQPTGGQPNTPDNSTSGTGGDIPDNVPNNEVPMVPPDDWEDPAQPEDSLPFPRDPRWDELQPGETAVQYYDIFIKSGMTLGEVVEAVESSDVYNDQFITWEIPRPTGYGEPNFTDLDNELTCEAPGKLTIKTSNGDETVTECGYNMRSTQSISIKCDDKTLMDAVFPTVLPGEEGTTYLVRDMPIILVKPDDKNDSVLTFMGTIGEINAMNREDLDGLLDTVFKVRDPDATVETSRETHKDSLFNRSYNVFRYTYRSWLPLAVSHNGYSLWFCPGGGEPAKGVGVYSIFEIEPDADKLYAGYGSVWELDNLGTGSVGYYLYWAADDAG